MPCSASSAGSVSVAFVKLLLWLRQRSCALPKSTVWLQPVVGGLTVGLLGFFVPEVLGVGYDYVERVAERADRAAAPWSLLAVLKIVATAVCYASGNAGGIFGPSLFIGAMMGGAVGRGRAPAASRRRRRLRAPTRWSGWARRSPASSARR